MRAIDEVISMLENINITKELLEVCYFVHLTFVDVRDDGLINFDHCCRPPD